VRLLCLRDVPTLIFVPICYLTKKQKYATNKVSTGLNIGEPKTYLLLLFLVAFYVYLFINPFFEYARLG
jgi:hypothetical protein